MARGFGIEGHDGEKDKEKYNLESERESPGECCTLRSEASVFDPIDSEGLLEVGLS